MAPSIRTPKEERSGNLQAPFLPYQSVVWGVHDCQSQTLQTGSCRIPCWNNSCVSVRNILLLVDHFSRTTPSTPKSSHCFLSPGPLLESSAWSSWFQFCCHFPFHVPQGSQRRISNAHQSAQGLSLLEILPVASVMLGKGSVGPSCCCPMTSPALALSSPPSNPELGNSGPQTPEPSPISEPVHRQLSLPRATPANRKRAGECKPLTPSCVF